MIKKIAAVLLCLIMCFSMAAPASASFAGAIQKSASAVANTVSADADEILTYDSFSGNKNSFFTGFGRSIANIFRGLFGKEKLMTSVGSVKVSPTAITKPDNICKVNVQTNPEGRHYMIYAKNNTYLVTNSSGNFVLQSRWKNKTLNTTTTIEFYVASDDGVIYKKVSQKISINIKSSSGPDYPPPVETVKVTYDANGGTGAPAAVDIEKGTSFTIPNTIPIKEGYEFLGWHSNKNAGESAPLMRAGDGFSLNNNLTLYAIWKKLPPQKGTITFDANGGIFADNTSSYWVYDEVGSVCNNISQPTKENCGFLGWALSANSSGVLSPSQITIIDGAIYYAVWGNLVSPTCLSYKFVNNEITITKCNQSTKGIIYIPSEINGYPVTAIDKDAFYKCAYLSSVVIPDSITSIGNYAFSYCTRLISVIIGNGVTSIGNWTFGDCTNLINITIGSRVSFIDDHVFYNCPKLENITVDANNMTYHSSSNCLIETEYKTLVVGCNNSIIPDDGSVTNIGEDAFYNRKGLTNITIPDSVTSIGEGAFRVCTELTGIAIPDSVISIDDYAFSGCTGLTSVTIGDSVRSIGDSAFIGCTGLTSITIPDSVTSIGDDAFYRCTGLTSITIPGSVTSIGSSVFKGCTNLANIDVNSNNQNYCSQNGVLLNKEKTLLMVYPANKTNSQYVVPGSVTNIDSYAFCECSGITEIVLSDNLTHIGDYAFCDCTGLTNIVIPDGVTTIGEYAFYDCARLASITIPDSVTSIGNFVFKGTRFYINSANWQNNALYIGNYLIEAERSISGSYTVKDGTTRIGERAFYNCSGITDIVIPDSVTSIGDAAFSGCTELASVTIGNGVASIGEDAFSGCAGLTSITIPDSVTSIGDDAFYRCTGLTSITIPGSVTSIGSGAFFNCNRLTSVTIGDGVKSIGSWAFQDCTRLESITLPDSITDIGNDVFYNTGFYKDFTNWKNNVLYIGNCLIEAESSVSGGYVSGSYVIKDGTTCIGNFAFSGCTRLTNITIPNSVVNIGHGAFCDCVCLTDITIPDSVISIGPSAFSGCTDLASVTIGSGVTDIAYRAFANCTGLTSVTIPDNVTNIKQYAFENCTGLTNVILGNGVTNISDYAFHNCTGLTGITIPDSVTTIGDYAFCECTNLASIVISTGVNTIGLCAFYHCPNLSDVYYCGTQENWNKINIEARNKPLVSAEIHYNSTGPNS